MKEALYYKNLPNSKVQCELCPHFCVIASNEIGICKVRKNLDGKLFAVNYAKTVTISIDPMEKKPLFHFYPGEKILSIGPNSCNFSCDFCQNYSISQFEVQTQNLSLESLLKVCKKHKSKFVAFTYTEPITWYEYILDASKFLHENDIKTVMVTNGFINHEPLKELLPHIDAMNIDLKSMDDDFYRRLCGGRLSPVLDTIKEAAEHCHVEVTNLLITGENDSEENIRNLVDFVEKIDVNIPLHFSKYYPQYKRSNPPTPSSSLNMAYNIAREKLNYVFLGNVLFQNQTNCPNCGELLIKREFHIKNYIKNNRCPDCEHLIYGKFD